MRICDECHGEGCEVCYQLGWTLVARKPQPIDWIGLCNCNAKIYEKDVLPAYKNLPENERRYRCSVCGRFYNADDMIPF